MFKTPKPVRYPADPNRAVWDYTQGTELRDPSMKELGDSIHSRGFKAGIYSSPGPSVTNDEVYVGSYQHEAEDARRFAAWGYDFLKYDWCSYEDVAGRRSATFGGNGTSVDSRAASPPPCRRTAWSWSV
jgi:alpha-galactosidase